MPKVYQMLQTVFLALVLVAALAPCARAQGLVIIRDTEIEESIKSWFAPVLDAAGMNRTQVKIVLIQNDDVNAFVAGGQNIFVYTGLLLKAQNADEVIGVLSHELGHIAGGHLLRKQEDFENASYEAILGTILGVGAAVATGQGDAIGALSTAGNSQALRRLYGASRVYESSADQAALSFLNAAKINPTGLLTFLQKLEGDESLPESQQSQYMMTHPLTRDRVEALSDRVEQSPFKNTPFPSEWSDSFARMQAKLLAFTSPARVAWTYDDRDVSVPARYARAIASYRQSDVEGALKQTRTLIALEPNNPYFYELLGQELKDFGRVKEAIPAYQKAIALKPSAPLFRIDYAHALVEGGTGPKEWTLAVQTLKRALADEPKEVRAWRLLGAAYGRLGDDPRAQLALAEDALLRRDFDRARTLAGSVRAALPNAGPESLRAQDILAEADRLDKTPKEDEDN